MILQISRQALFLLLLAIYFVSPSFAMTDESDSRLLNLYIAPEHTKPSIIANTLNIITPGAGDNFDAYVDDHFNQNMGFMSTACRNSFGTNLGDTNLNENNAMSMVLGFSVDLQKDVARPALGFNSAREGGACQ